MFKKGLIWFVWVTTCFFAGFFGTKLFMKGVEIVSEKLAECD